MVCRTSARSFFSPKTTQRHGISLLHSAPPKREPKHPQTSPQDPPKKRNYILFFLKININNNIIMAFFHIFFVFFRMFFLRLPPLEPPTQAPPGRRPAAAALRQLRRLSRGALPEPQGLSALQGVGGGGRWGGRWGDVGGFTFLFFIFLFLLCCSIFEEVFGWVFLWFCFFLRWEEVFFFFDKRLFCWEDVFLVNNGVFFAFFFNLSGFLSGKRRYLTTYTIVCRISSEGFWCCRGWDSGMDV